MKKASIILVILLCGVLSASPPFHQLLTAKDQLITASLYKVLGDSVEYIPYDQAELRVLKIPTSELHLILPKDSAYTAITPPQPHRSIRIFTTTLSVIYAEMITKKRKVLQYIPVSDGSISIDSIALSKVQIIITKEGEVKRNKRADFQPAPPREKPFVAMPPETTVAEPVVPAQPVQPVKPVKPMKPAEPATVVQLILNDSTILNVAELSYTKNRFTFINRDVDPKVVVEIYKSSVSEAVWSDGRRKKRKKPTVKPPSPRLTEPTPSEPKPFNKKVRLLPPTSKGSTPRPPRSGMTAIAITPSWGALGLGIRNWSTSWGQSVRLQYMKLDDVTGYAGTAQVMFFSSSSGARKYVTPGITYQSISSSNFDLSLLSIFAALGIEWRSGINKNHGWGFEIGYQKGEADYTMEIPGFAGIEGIPGTSTQPTEISATYEVPKLYLGFNYAYYY